MTKAGKSPTSSRKGHGGRGGPNDAAEASAMPDNVDERVMQRLLEDLYANFRVASQTESDTQIRANAQLT